MSKLTKIKHLLWQSPIQNIPKYLVFISLLCSAVLPTQASGLQAQIVPAEKPALLALADVRFSISLPSELKNDTTEFTFIQGSALISQTNPFREAATRSNSAGTKNPKIISIKKQVIVTAYSSTPDQTDSTPFITALGTHVRDGIVAANFLPFGTKIRLPEVYGDKIFVVEDRMAKKNSHKIDIWMPDRQLALQFGVKQLTLEILE